MTLLRTALPFLILVLLPAGCAAPRGTRPAAGMATTTDGRKAFVASPRAGTVTVVDRWNGVVEETVTLEGRPEDVVIVEALHAAAVSLADEDGIVFLNLASNAEVGEVREGIGPRPGPLAVSPDGGFLFVGNTGARNVSVVALTGGPARVVKRMEVGGTPVSISAGWPGGRLWVTTREGESPVVLVVPGMEDWRPAAPPSEDLAQAGTQVLVLGMIHDGHRTSALWGLEQVKETIRNFRPDVILCEIPPDRWERARDEYEDHGSVEEPRVKRFPEYIDAMLPLRAELGFEVEPCAAWTKEMSDLRNRRLRELDADPRLRELVRAYHAAEDEVEADLAAHPIVDDDPRVIHSARYDERTKKELGPYDHYLDRYIGPGGWTAINRGHFELIERALDRHRGERVLITFGAGHKYWILEHLRQRPDVTILDAEPFLPDAGAR